MATDAVSLLPTTYEVYTDGSLDPGTRQGAWAFVIVVDGEKTVELFGKEPRTDSNVMEITAAIKALETIPHGSKVVLYSDSRVLTDMMTREIGRWKRAGWRRRSGRTVKNYKLFQQLDQLASHLIVSWRWVQGHNGNVHNERCDHLCKLARAA